MKRYPIISWFYIYMAIDEYLSNVIRVRYWNHTINAIKHRLRKHRASTVEIPVYISNVRELLNQSTEERYLENMKLYQVKWSEAFDKYYMNEIHPEVCGIFIRNTITIQCLSVPHSEDSYLSPCICTIPLVESLPISPKVLMVL